MSKVPDKRQAAEARGRKGEAKAALYLRLKGWRIIAARARTPVGEVDIIAHRGRTVAFVEVKTRATKADLDLAVDAFRLRRVAAAAEQLFHQYLGIADEFRIDVILVAPRSMPRHLENVWHG